MDKARKQGFELLMLGCAVFMIVGTLWTASFVKTELDFRHVYCGARTLVQQHDPYNPDNVERVCQAAGAAPTPDAGINRVFVTHMVYPPSTFAITILFGILPFPMAQILWSAIAAVVTIVAAYLIWKSTAGYAPLAMSGLLCIFLINSPTLFIGNPAGIDVGLCAIGAWCLVEERFILPGVLCLAASLLVKPHDPGLIWLYFVLAGKNYRRRGLLVLAIVVCASIPVTLWVWHLSPHWIQEWHSDLQAFTLHGEMNDPGPSTGGGRGILMITDLQAVFSFIKDDPRFYNLASYCVCALLLVVWTAVTLRSKVTRQNTWLALAAIAPLTMLPLYHRQYDAKLIILMLPACAALWMKRERLGWFALILTFVVVVLDGDFTWFVLSHFFSAWYPPDGSFLVAFPVPLSLLGATCFYLWAYARNASQKDGDHTMSEIRSVR
jgi:hypothetical protein